MMNGGIRSRKLAGDATRIRFVAAPTMRVLALLLVAGTASANYDDPRKGGCPANNSESLAHLLSLLSLRQLRPVALFALAPERL